MDDPFSNYYLLLWFADGDDVLQSYYEDLNVANEKFDTWVRESRENEEQHAIIMMINLYETIKTKSLRTERVWETQYDNV